MQGINFYFSYNTDSDTLDVLLHGGSKGIESSFIQKLFKASQDNAHSVIAFNFPYLDRGEEQSSGPELQEELEVLKRVIEYASIKEYRHIRLIGKSLGGIVASYFSKKLPIHEQKKYSVIILGYVLGSVDLKEFTGNIVVIQGSNDKFGNIEKVKSDLEGLATKKITYINIDGADHSFRDLETKEPVYEDVVIEKVNDLVTES